MTSKEPENTPKEEPGQTNDAPAENKPVSGFPTQIIDAENPKHNEEPARNKSDDQRSGLTKLIRVERMFAGAVIASTIAQGIFSYYQWNEAAKQTILMKRQLDDAEESGKESAAQSKAALDASIEASRNDQRPWITITAGDATGIIDSGPKRITFRVSNAGKSPARHTRAIRKLFTGATNMKIPKELFPREADTPAPEVPTTIPPGGQAIFYMDFSATSPEEIKSVSAGTRGLYLIGEIKYDDAYGRSEAEAFSFFWEPKVGSLMSHDQ